MSAKIIAGILDTIIACEGAIDMFVSHPSDLIFENAIFSIRWMVLKRGLDDDLNLIVERSPRIDYFAKSAPQLIVEWVSQMSMGG